MSRIERTLFSYNAIDKNKQIFSLGNKSTIKYSLSNNSKSNIKIYMPLTHVIPLPPIKEMKPQQLHHTCLLAPRRSKF